MDASLVFVTLIWALNFAVVKGALSHLSPFAFNNLRLIGASILFLVLAQLSRGPALRRGDWKNLFVLGLIGHTGYQLFYIHGIARTTAGNAAVLLGLTPVFVAMMGWLARRERSGGRAWIGIALSIFGVFLVLRDSTDRGGSAPPRPSSRRRPVSLRVPGPRIGYAHGIPQ